jgi:hypothetical protein
MVLVVDYPPSVGNDPKGNIIVASKRSIRISNVLAGWESRSSRLDFDVSDNTSQPMGGGCLASVDGGMSFC